MLSNPDVIELAEQADTLQDIKAIYDQKGGKLLVNLLLTDVVNNMHKLMGSFDKCTHTEMLAIIAEMKVHYYTAKLLVSSKENLELLDAELQDILRQ